MSRYAQAERRALADLLLELGPEAPTLCEGWTARDLAAHLVTRERRPDAGLGVLFPPLRRHGEAVRTAVAARPYPRVVAELRHPPVWSPVSNPLVEGVTNVAEMFIHHEDLRRGQPAWQPRSLGRDFEAALWSRTRTLARLRLRRFPGSVLVQAPGLGDARAGAGGPALRLVGAPGELLMFLTGRQRAARVQLDGAAEVAAKLRGRDLRM
ncbi:TIGR03085 family metal-binding protein [Rhizomonospora bruguierae]|uniref:TIGR03085 family metal-binding protein n=1 Tax=Rhizomonospora bruguierae TaxID=1581705 RepID=UPI001BCC591F|nr:TIGR03085 family metal-binding protein [Micromonospora sp. NBRC 107566]